MKTVFVLFSYQPINHIDGDGIGAEKFIGVFSNIKYAKETAQKMWEYEKRMIEKEKIFIFAQDYLIEELAIEDKGVEESPESIKSWTRESHNDDGKLVIMPWEEL